MLWLAWPRVLTFSQVLIRIKRNALISHRYPKWDIAIWAALLRIATLNLYTMRWPYSECSTPYSRVSYSDCPSPSSRVSYSECSTPYKCALLRIDTIRSPTLYKNPAPVGARARVCLDQAQFLLSSQKDWKLAANYNYDLKICCFRI